MSYHILGLGPIGTLLAYHLRAALPSSNVTLIHRTARAARDAHLLGDAIRVERDGVASSVGGFRSEIFETSYEEVERKRADADKPEVKHRGKRKVFAAAPDQGTDDEGLIDTLFVTVKAQSTVPAISKLLPRLSPYCTIVLMQNGMGVHEQLVSTVFRNPQYRPHFILASLNHGAWLKSMYHVVHAGLGAINFAIMPDLNHRNFEAGLSDTHVPMDERKLRLEDLSPPNDPEAGRYRTLLSAVTALTALETLNAAWKPITEVHLIMRVKLVVNAVINTLTALMGCRNGEIFKQLAAKEISRDVCTEAAAVYAAQMKAEAHAWLQESGHSADDRQLEMGRVPLALTAEALQQECERVGYQTRVNISSMLADIRRGRGTEIDYINGYLVDLGSTYNVPTPVTSTLYHLVKTRMAIPLDQTL